MAWNVPWNLSFNYSVNYGYGEFDYNKLEYKGKITQKPVTLGQHTPYHKLEHWFFGFL